MQERFNEIELLLRMIEAPEAPDESKSDNPKSQFPGEITEETNYWQEILSNYCWFKCSAEDDTGSN